MLYFEKVVFRDVHFEKYPTFLASSINYARYITCSEITFDITQNLCLSTDLRNMSGISFSCSGDNERHRQFPNDTT